MSKPMGGISTGNDNRCQVITGEATDDGRNDPAAKRKFRSMTQRSEQFLLLRPLGGH